MTPGECAFCRLIGGTITLEKKNYREDFQIELGSSAALIGSAENCENWRIILSHAPEPKGEALEPETQIRLLNVQLPDSDYQICDEGQDTLYLEPMPLTPIAGRSRGVLLDSKWIDLRRISNWLQYCDNSHGSSCRDFSTNLKPVDLLLLIDVVSECLVEAPGTVKYFALSYVWGKDPDGKALETTLGNLTAHTVPGSLSLNREYLLLPDTIKDSMRLVRSLNERYLWVDRLCIVQDDLERKPKQIQAMGAIYAYSYCTILATDGQDSHYGLRGIGNGSQPRSCTQKILEFPDTRCLVTKNV